MTAGASVGCVAELGCATESFIGTALFGTMSLRHLELPASTPEYTRFGSEKAEERANSGVARAQAVRAPRGWRRTCWGS